MTFYQKYFDCGRLMSDFYVNTPRVSTTRNHTPSFINLRWGPDINPDNAVVEFYNYYSILPSQQARTFTTRGSFGIYPVTSPDLQVPLSTTVAVPPFAQRFRIRLNGSGPLVTNFVPVKNNNMYFIESGRIYQLYDF
jgi:hypothetical protein